jgi:hypothetical protein
MSHTTPWILPQGATLWPEGVESARKRGERVATRSLDDLPSLGWYREAHKDYVQTLVETGVMGLLIALWAAWAAVRTVPRSLAARGGVERPHAHLRGLRPADPRPFPFCAFV